MDLIARNKSLSICLLIFTYFIHSSSSSIYDFIVPHNEARAQVGVQPLKWNDTLASYARWYAYQRLGDCNLRHSQGPFGENLAEGYGDEFTATDAVKLWVNEKQNYEYESNSCVGDQCLHYTQVVWRNTTHVGCARVKCYNDWMFVICSYDPPGNYVGERPY